MLQIQCQISSSSLQEHVLLHDGVAEKEDMILIFVFKSNLIKKDYKKNKIRKLIIGLNKTWTISRPPFPLHFLSELFVTAAASYAAVFFNFL